jgi:hypothetical protein
MRRYQGRELGGVLMWVFQMMVKGEDLIVSLTQNFGKSVAIK